MKVIAIMKRDRAELDGIVLEFSANEADMQRIISADLSAVFGGYGMVSTADGGWAITVRGEGLIEGVESILVKFYPEEVVSSLMANFTESGYAEIRFTSYAEMA